MADHSKWAEEQIQALMDIGIDEAEAQRSINWVLKNMPEGADPSRWIPTAAQLDTPLDEADIQDARTDWYAKDSVPPEFNRLLDAAEEDSSEDAE